MVFRVTEEEAKRLLGGPSLPIQLAPGYKRKKKTQAESSVRKASLDLLHAWGIFAWKNNTGAYKRQYSRKDGSQDSAWIAYGYPGSGDILGLTKRTGRFFSVETKTDENDLQENQEEFRDLIVKSGGLYIVVRNIETLVEKQHLFLE